MNQAPLSPPPPSNEPDGTIDDVEEKSDPATASRSPLGSLPKIVKFDALARCGDEIWIENEGQIYRLRKTRQGKLILTK